MSRFRFISGWSFRAKMLIAVTVVVSLLVAVSLWLVSQKFKQQIHNNAAGQLHTAEGVLKIRRQTREEELMLRFKSVSNEPKIKAGASNLLEQKALLTPEGQKTIQEMLQEMVETHTADVVVLTPEPNSGGGVAVSGIPGVDPVRFNVGCVQSIQRAFAGESEMVPVEEGGHLFDVVSMPVMVSGNVGGVLTFAVENSLPVEFRQLMNADDDLVLLLGGQIVCSTLRSPVPSAALSLNAMATKTRAGDMQEADLGSEHYWGIAGWLPAGNGAPTLGYLILSSYTKPLEVLRSTERAILLIGLLAILSGITVVWFLIHKITGPLRELQVSAEAVGRGDFSRRVDIRTRDEFGRLGRAFNQMTQDIERSHSELKQMVATLKTTQAQLIQSEKLSAVGEFVAGVAHELNNPLAAVMGFSEMLKDADVSENHRRHLDLIFKSAMRCRKIVQSLLSFARRHQPERKPVAVNKLIEEVLEIVAYQLRTSNVAVECRFSPQLPMVLADGHQIQQVVLNLVNNARQAIESHQESGCISISTELREAVIRIVFQDSGPGISPDNISRIFDPFFTTKEVGKGTGLGLSLCYGLIQEHGGNIIATSEPGKGATFTIELPATADSAPLAAPAPAKVEAPNPKEGLGRKILMVDDEHILLEMVCDSLKCHGYEVVTANNGEAALRALHDQKIDAVCTDLKMPGINGRQLYDWIRSSRPNFARRVVFMTGDVINEPLRLFFEQEQLVCLNKPFAASELRQAIRDVLAESSEN